MATRWVSTWSRLPIIGSARRAVSLRPPERLSRREQTDDERGAGSDGHKVGREAVHRERGERSAGQRPGDRGADAGAAEPEREEEHDAEEHASHGGQEPSDDRPDDEG